MKRFLVKVTSTATKENKNFAGAVKVRFYGRDERSFDEQDNELYKLYITDKYGYTRKCDAKKNFNFHYPTTETVDGSVIWEKEIEIVEVEI